tara:strand:- start:172 stop:861 length:690 start_codon:yes stop_codon:yes gene_type:complete
MKNHLKRIAVPRTWAINRKKRVFIVRPKPGPHSLDMGLPLGVVLRDNLNLARTISEAKKLLNNNEVLIDGKRRKDHRFIVGLLDILSFSGLNKYYRVQLNRKGKIVFVEITKDESKTKICKIVGKTVLAKGKLQFNLHNGRNLVTELDAKVGDSVVVGLPKFDVKKVLPLKSGMTIFLTQGKHIGDVGILKETQGVEAKYTADGKEIETAKAYLFVVGEKESLLKLKNE